MSEYTAKPDHSMPETLVSIANLVRRYATLMKRSGIEMTMSKHIIILADWQGVLNSYFSEILYRINNAIRISRYQ